MGLQNLNILILILVRRFDGNVFDGRLKVSETTTRFNRKWKRIPGSNGARKEGVQMCVNFCL